MKVRVGTSGYAIPDWRGAVYPLDLPQPRWLPYYSRELGFNCVEINATYYRPLAAKSFAAMAECTPADFLFSVKGNRVFTHDLFDHRLPGRPDEAAALAAARAFAATLAPLGAANKLAALLLQFPVFFAPTPAARAYLLRLRDALPGLRLVIEFRHGDWAQEDEFAFLRDNGLAYCAVDEPPLPRLLPLLPRVTAAPGYLRLHGRNPDWFNATLSRRYDYNYTAAELRELLPAVDALAAAADEVFVFFNNCHLGHAVRNAHALQDLLGIVRPPAALFD